MVLYILRLPSGSSCAIDKLCVSDHDNKDGVMLGHVTFGHKNGQRTSADYVGNFAFTNTEQGPRIEKYQSWMVGFRVMWHWGILF